MGLDEHRGAIFLMSLLGNVLLLSKMWSDETIDVEQFGLGIGVVVVLCWQFMNGGKRTS